MAETNKRSRASSIYVFWYNILSCFLWTSLTMVALCNLMFWSSNSLYYTFLSPLTKIQTLALIEIIHAATGLVNASLLMTAVQLGGKNLVLWTIMKRFPDIVAGSDNGAGPWGFCGCLLAWGLSEMVRYGYFTTQLTRNGAPMWLKWLRYNAFIVLYPLGLLSEALLVYLCLTQAEDISQFYRAYMFTGLCAYFPLGYLLYTHMLAQRRKISNRDAD